MYLIFVLNMSFETFKSISSNQYFLKLLEMSEQSSHSDKYLLGCPWD